MMTFAIRSEDEPIPGMLGCAKVHKFGVITCERCGAKFEGYAGTHLHEIKDMKPGETYDGTRSCWSMWMASRHAAEHKCPISAPEE